MANVKISELTAATTYDTDDVLAGVDTSATASKKFPKSVVLAGLLGGANGLLKANGSGVLSAAAAGTDYLAPSGSGASLTGITATQIGSVPAGILKGSGGAFVAAVSGTDYEPPITAGTTAQYLRGDKSLATLNQAAVAGLTTASSPAFAGLTVGSLSGLLKASSGVVAAAVAGTDYLTTSFAGSSSITTVGTITSGTWNGTTLAIANGGTGQTTASGAINALVPSQTGNNGMVLGTNGTSVSWVAVGGTGTVTSVGLTVPSWMTVTGSPVTGAGTLAVSPATGQTANQFVATPDGSTGGVSLRSIASGDIPTLASSKVTAPGSDGQFIRNSGGAFTGSTRLLAGTGNSINFVPTADPGSPVDGDLWFSSSQKALSYLSAGMVTRGGGSIYQALSAGTAVVNTTTQTSLFAGVSSWVGSLTFPANSLKAGMILRPAFFGSSTNAGTTTLNFTILLGSTAIINITSTALSATTGSTNIWILLPMTVLQIQSVGASGSAIGTLMSYVGSAGSIGTIGGGSGSAGAQWTIPTAVTLDTTVSLAFDIQAKWSIASASNRIQLLGGGLFIDG